MSITTLEAFTLPRGYKRSLSKKEMEYMRKNYKSFSFTSFVDLDDRIFLGNGIDEGGYSFITYEYLKSVIQ